MMDVFLSYEVSVNLVLGGGWLEDPLESAEDGGLEEHGRQFAVPGDSV